MATTKKRQTNVEFVRDLMEFSCGGALVQPFILTAIERYSKMVAEADPKELDNALISGEAWQRIGKELLRKLEERYASL